MKKQLLIKRVFSLLMAAVMLVGAMYLGLDVKAEETGEATDTTVYHDIQVSFVKYDTTNKYLVFDAKIISEGANYGKSLVDVYGDWKINDVTSAILSYVKGEELGTKTAAWFSYKEGDNSYLGVTISDVTAYSEFSVAAGSVLIPTVGNSTTPIRFVNGIRIVKDNQGNWQSIVSYTTEYHEATIDSVLTYDDDFDNIYLDVSVTGELDNGKTIGELYGPFDTGWRYIGKTYYKGYKLVLWAINESQICIQGTKALAEAGYTEIMLPAGTVFEGQEGVIPIRLGNALRIVINTGKNTWEEAKNEISISYNRVEGNYLYLNAVIAGGADKGKTLQKAYGDDWKTKWDLGNGITAYNYGATLCVQGYDLNTVSEVVFDANTVYRANSSDTLNSNATRMAFVNGLKLRKNESGIWEALENQITVSFHSMYPDKRDGIYLNAQITAGTNANDTFTDAYGDAWKTAWKLAGGDVRLYHTGEAQIAIEGLGMQTEGVDDVMLEVGSVFEATDSDSAAPIRLANGLRFVKNESGTWEVAENEITVSFGYVEGDNVYLDAVLTAGPDAGETIGKVYGTTWTTEWQTNGARVYATGTQQICVQGLGITNADTTEVLLKEGTILYATYKSPSATNIVLAESLKLIKSNGTWHDARDLNCDKSFSDDDLKELRQGILSSDDSRFDMNYDGTVNVKDIICLKKYISSKNVSL